ncbi:MAG: RNA polymerase sigma-70 factor [Bacteroidetes bacterium]|nr:RNA polymerase sigma-70 factor [Bacteroidota bacterium]
MRFVKDYETSREIVQDAFITLWEKRNSIDIDKPVKSYLSTTVRNKCLNYLRDHKKFNVNLLDLEGVLKDFAYEQSDRLVEAEIRVKIDDAMNELPEKCREVFLLSRTQNLKYQEIADKLEISVKTVETQMSKALQHMRIRLKEYIPAILVLIYFLFRTFK